MLLSASCASTKETNGSTDPSIIVEAASPAKNRDEKTDPWTTVEADGLAAVAWSPRSDQIAFVASSLKDDTDGSLDRASIWVMTVPKHGETIELRRLAVVTWEQGIPSSALFWLDDDRIGWAARVGHDYTFMQMGLHDSKPQRLVNQSFTGSSDMMETYGTGAPDDVYYDADSKTLFFSGGLTPTGVYVRILPLDTKKVRNLSIPHPKGLSYPEGYISHVTCCGSLRDPQKPVLYIATLISTGSGGGWYLWRSDSYSLRQDKIIASPDAITSFPRISPNGDLLACIRYVGKDTTSEIALYDLESGKDRTLVTRSPGYLSAPVNGCPFSWSPDGKQIAYADGSKIKIVDVVSGHSE